MISVHEELSNEGLIMKIGEETAELQQVKDNPESFLHDFSYLSIYLGMWMSPVLVFSLVFVSIVGVLLGKRLRFWRWERLGPLAATAVGEAWAHKPSRTRLLPGFECSGPADWSTLKTHSCRILEHDKVPFLTMAPVSVLLQFLAKGTRQRSTGERCEQPAARCRADVRHVSVRFVSDSLTRINLPYASTLSRRSNSKTESKASWPFRSISPTYIPSTTCRRFAIA